MLLEHACNAVEVAPGRTHLPTMRVAPVTPDLFGRPELPAGLDHQDDFLSPAEEVHLIAAFAELPFREATFQQYTARRRVVRFGLGYDAESERWVAIDALPDWLAALRERVAARQRVAEGAFVHALVTEYRPGTPIGWHRDKPEYGMVVGISLGGRARMRFRPYDNRKDRAAVMALELAPRSLYVMQEDVRWLWQHSIPPVKSLRYSITLRTRASTRA